MKKKTNQETKTIEQWLQDLPEPARSQALKNMWWEDKDSRYCSLDLALAQAFNWSTSPEKCQYWKDIHNSLKNETT